MITYDLWWGDSYLCANWTDLTELLEEVRYRMDGTFKMRAKITWFYQNTNDIADAIDTRTRSAGVLLIGVTPRMMVDKYTIPPRAYQIMWREVQS